MRSSRTLARTRRLILYAGLALIPSTLLAPGASAGTLVASAPDCEAETLTRPFLPWLDPAQYKLAPDGGFEAGAAGWALEGGAEVVAGNESYYVRDAGDSQALSLPGGSSATSPTTCVGLEHPTLRVFARNTGSPLSSLRVTVHFEDAAGNEQELAIGQLTAGSSWNPSVQMVIVANLLPLLPGEQTPVAFEFTPHGSAGEWRIDDVYVDPMRRS